MSQLNLLADGWLRRSEIRSFISYMRAVEDVGHIHEPEYDYFTSWPKFVEHARLGKLLGWCQRARAVYQLDALVSMCRERSPIGCTHWRFIFTNDQGIVVDESAWCSTEGGARGYLNRARGAG